jgi:hypothetical protein
MSDPQHQIEDHFSMMELRDIFRCAIREVIERNTPLGFAERLFYESWDDLRNDRIFVSLEIIIGEEMEIEEKRQKQRL